MSLQIQLGKFVTKGGKYARIDKRIIMRVGSAWQGAVLSHFNHRGGLQHVWDENGKDAGGLSQYDLVAPAMIDAG